MNSLLILLTWVNIYNIIPHSNKRKTIFVNSFPTWTFLCGFIHIELSKLKTITTWIPLILQLKNLHNFHIIIQALNTTFLHPMLQKHVILIRESSKKGPHSNRHEKDHLVNLDK
jgi:hypothetical protein